MNIENNLSIWHQVDKTDHASTKDAKVNGMKITSINPISVIKKATEVFGPVGRGWGYEIIEEAFQTGAPIIVGNAKIADEIMHTLRVRVWYKIDDEKHSVDHYGHTPYIQKTQYGPKTDFDAPKKSLSDALKKALSMLGFNADVFLGLWEDEDYVAAAKLESQINTADDKDDEKAAQLEKFNEELEAQVLLFESARSLATLKAMVEAAKSKFARKAQVLGKDHGSVQEFIAESGRKAGMKLKTEETCETCGTVEKRLKSQPCSACNS